MESGGQGTRHRHRRRRAVRPGARTASLLGAINRAMARDIETGRGFLLWPVAFAGAAAIYFALPVEPPLAPVAAAAAATVTAAVLTRRHRGRAPLAAVLLAMACAGLLAAKLRVDGGPSPVLVETRSMDLSGTVLSVEDRAGRGHRMLVAVDGLRPPPREGVPRTVRLTIRGDSPPPRPGERIEVAARLGPPQAPVYPGGYDFARTAWFAGIGGVGFSLGPAKVAPAADDLPLSLSAVAAVERFRLGVSADIRARLPGDAGSIAAALIVGDRGSIDPATDEAMRISGLSHILSISGLHMALVAACLFGGLRALLAFWPRLAASVPIKEIAAAVALAGTGAYLVIAGMSLPTQRSAVMIAITLGAVILGRQAFSLRNVAIAALVVGAIRPDAVLDPGAQLSFAAVTALIAGFEAVAARRRPAPDRGDVSRLVRILTAVPLWIGLSMLTSLLAGVATAPIALHHFNRAAPLGLLANLVATPLVSLLIMPAAVVAVLAMPFGLQGWPLAAMGFGIDGMVSVAEVVAGWTPGGGTFGRPAPAGTLLVVLGGLWLCLWTGAARLPGVPLILAGLVLMPMAERPDLVVAGDGGRLMVRIDGELRLVGRPDDFETGIWLAALGDPRDPSDPSLVRDVRCDPEACILAPAGPDGRRRTLVALIRQPAAFDDECGEAALVISSIPVPDRCRERTTTIDADDLSAGGARTYRRLPPSDPTSPAASTQTALSTQPAPSTQPATSTQTALTVRPSADTQSHAATRPGPARDPGLQATPADATDRPAEDVPARAGHDIGPRIRHTGWALEEIGRAIPPTRRPFHTGTP